MVRLTKGFPTWPGCSNICCGCCLRSSVRAWRQCAPLDSQLTGLQRDCAGGGAAAGSHVGFDVEHINAEEWVRGRCREIGAGTVFAWLSDDSI